MPREFRDLVVGESDGKARYNLIDREGGTVAEEVRVEIASDVLQPGDPYGALAANQLLYLDDDGTPQMKTVQLQNGGTGRTDGIHWNHVQAKPAAFPPAAHNQDWNTVTGKPAAFPPVGHTHSMANIIGVLPVAQGGSGNTTGAAAGVRNMLKGNQIKFAMENKVSVFTNEAGNSSIPLPQKPIPVVHVLPHNANILIAPFYDTDNMIWNFTAYDLNQSMYNLVPVKSKRIEISYIYMYEE